MRLSGFENTVNSSSSGTLETNPSRATSPDVNEGKNGRWYAWIEGTADYRAEITLDDNDVLHYP